MRAELTIPMTNTLSSLGKIFNDDGTNLIPNGPTKAQLLAGFDQSLSISCLNGVQLKQVAANTF